MNPVIGNRALNECPLATTQGHYMAEIDKVRCHLSFALQKLKAKSKITYKENGPQCTFNRRNELLSALETYIEEGNFPKHEDVEAFLQNKNTRKPCFVDSTGTPCAVAYLMQKSGGEMLVNDILDASHKHDTIDQIAQNDTLKTALKSWSSSVGMETSDLALIQPTYKFKGSMEERQRQIQAIQDHYNIEPARRGKDCTLSKPFLDENGKPTAKIPTNFMLSFKKDLQNDATRKEVKDILTKWDASVHRSFGPYLCFSASTADKASGAAKELREKEYIESISHDAVSSMYY